MTGGCQQEMLISWRDLFSHAVTGQDHANNSPEDKTAQDGGILVGFTLPFSNMFKSLQTIILFFTA